MIGASGIPAYRLLEFDQHARRVPTFRTFAGTPYRRSVPVGMPRIDHTLLHSTFYLYPSKEAAKDGAKFGGTGFFVGYPTGVPEAPVLLYAVTNWHVAVRDGASVMRINTTTGGVDILEFDPRSGSFFPVATI